MAGDKFEKLRLSIMQNFLPVGIGVVDRARKGGMKKVMEVFTSESDSFTQLRSEGELQASSIRDYLDDFSPGLGNPIMSVDVVVEDVNVQETSDNDSLMKILSRVDNKLNKLNNYFQNQQNRSNN
tara:strand:- start:5 stop:379 length:375 start_codon:yes stop_codon:yes gene_type:complete